MKFWFFLIFKRQVCDQWQQCNYKKFNFKWFIEVVIYHYLIDFDEIVNRIYMN